MSYDPLPDLTEKQFKTVHDLLLLKYSEEEILQADHPCSNSKTLVGYPPNLKQKWSPIEYYIRDNPGQNKVQLKKKWVKMLTENKTKYLHLSTIDAERYVLQCRQANVHKDLVRSYVHAKVKFNREKKQRILSNARIMRERILKKYGAANLCVCVNGNIACNGKRCVMVPEFEHQGKWDGELF